MLLPARTPTCAAAVAAAAASAWRRPAAVTLLAAAQQGRGSRQQHHRAAAASSTPTEPACIYDRPQLYDDAFSYRDFQAEAKFLMGAYQRHAQPAGQLQAVLELGCGPANHAIQLAQRGVQAWALDNNASMLRYAADKAAAAGVSLTTVQGDMTSCAIQGMEARFDMVLCLLGTLSHCLDNKQAAAAFRQAARHLKPGGMFVLELAHPGDLFDGSLLLGDTGGAEMWEVDKGASAPKLMVIWGTETDMFDPETQVVNRTVSIHSMKGDDLDQRLLEEVVPYRQFTTQEVDLLATLAGLEVVGVYGDLDLNVSLTHEDAFRLVMVLRKPAAAEE